MRAGATGTFAGAIACDPKADRCHVRDHTADWGPFTRARGIPVSDVDGHIYHYDPLRQYPPRVVLLEWKDHEARPDEAAQERAFTATITYYRMWGMWVVGAYPSSPRAVRLWGPSGAYVRHAVDAQALGDLMEWWWHCADEFTAWP